MIEQLINEGKIEEALSELVKIAPDAILLKGQYASAKRENSLGLLDGDDWRRAIKRITESALKLYGEAAGVKSTQQTSLLDAARFAEALLSQNTDDVLAIQATAMLRQAIKDSMIHP